MDSRRGQSDISDQEVIGKSLWSVKLTTFVTMIIMTIMMIDDWLFDDWMMMMMMMMMTLLVLVRMRPLVLRADVVLKDGLLELQLVKKFSTAIGQHY